MGNGALAVTLGAIPPIIAVGIVADIGLDLVDKTQRRTRSTKRKKRR